MNDFDERPDYHEEFSEAIRTHVEAITAALGCDESQVWEQLDCLIQKAADIKEREVYDG